MRRSPVTVLLAAFAAAVGCRGSDPQPLVLVLRDDFSSIGSGVVLGGGEGELLAYTRERAIRTVRHRAADQAHLELVAELTGDQGVRGAGLSGQVLWYWDDYDFCAVDLSVSPATVRKQWLYGFTPITAAVQGRWAAVLGSWVNGQQWLRLLDLESTEVPGYRQLDGLPALTALVASGGGFLAFTPTGYGVLDPAAAAPAFTFTDDLVLRAFRVAFPSGTAGAVVAGPAARPGASLVARLDLTAPAAPRLVRSIEVEGAFSQFAYGGSGPSVIGVEDPWGRSTSGFLLEERGGAWVVLEEIPLPLQNWAGQNIAAHAGYLLASDVSGVALLRMR